MPKLTNRGPAGLLKKPGSGPTKLTNRGPAGLLSKLHKEEKKDGQKVQPQPQTGGRINYIQPSLKKVEIVAISSLVPDPMNARLHPERNLDLIKQSLTRYGQATPLTVKKKGRVVMKGNGTLEAAKQLGWTKIAVHFVDFSEAEAAGYGVADNRTAEFAKWNFKVVAMIDEILQKAKQPSLVGWTEDEIEVLRMAEWDWEKPEITEDTFDAKGKHSLIFTPEQFEVIGRAVERVRDEQDDPKLPMERCIELICEEWMEQ